ncbi:hypothetical protein ACFQY7_56260 [Actinomadura luteofluorescens]|uniref:hypothetical protein n=1 Tax=Actinomadura luteofluorescens TaxID=46163 RepID=UPI0036268C21
MIGYVVAVSLSCLVGIAELVSRYRDRPTTLVRVPSTWAYVLINGERARARCCSCTPSAGGSASSRRTSPTRRRCSWRASAR